MKKIWISDFRKNNSLIKDCKEVILLVPYFDDYPELVEDMIKLGFKHDSTRFVGPDLMDTEQCFKKILTQN